MSDIDVLVVGAGPTGLVAAVELARRGVRVRVVDKVPPRPYAESRAEGVHARTLEIVERLGLLPQVLDQGRVLAGFGFHNARRPLGVLSAAGLDSPHAHAVLLPQSAFEAILLDHLATLGVTVERPVELLDVEQSAGDVTARLRGGPGTETVTARFLVAADGAHSVVRKQLGVAFDGSRIQGAYVMDAVATFAHPPAADLGTFVLARGGFLVVGLRPDGTYRIALSLPARDGRIAADRPSRDELQGLLDEFRLGVRLESVSWSSAFFISSRHVERLRHGRILLAGDAAHIHSPVGGQGMNTGVQDAVNLGWKLALAVAGRGGEALLDSYDVERLPVIRRLIASTTRSTTPLLWRHPAATAVRDLALRLLLRVPSLQTALFDGFTGFTVRYPDSPLTVAEERPALPGGPRPGEIAPEAGGDRWYRHWADDPRHPLLVFTGPGTDHEAVLAWARTQAELVRPLLVAPQRGVGRGEVDVVTDPTGALHRRFGATGGGTYLVRPDGIVAARAAAGDIAPLRRYVELLATVPAAARRSGSVRNTTNSTTRSAARPHTPTTRIWGASPEATSPPAGPATFTA